MKSATLIKRIQLAALLVSALTVGTSFAQQAFADASEPIATAQSAMAKSDWASAEKALLPASQLKPANPFVYYEMARVYENTNRVEAARQIYQGLVALPDAEQRQYTMVVRNTKEQYMTTLTAQAQSRLNAIGSQPVVVARAAPVSFFQKQNGRFPKKNCNNLKLLKPNFYLILQVGELTEKFQNTLLGCIMTIHFYSI